MQQRKRRFAPAAVADPQGRVVGHDELFHNSDRDVRDAFPVRKAKIIHAGDTVKRKGCAGPGLVGRQGGRGPCRAVPLSGPAKFRRAALYPGRPIRYSRRTPQRIENPTSAHAAIRRAGGPFRFRDDPRGRRFGRQATVPAVGKVRLPSGELGRLVRKMPALPFLLVVEVVEYRFLLAKRQQLGIRLVVVHLAVNGPLVLSAFLDRAELGRPP